MMTFSTSQATIHLHLTLQLLNAKVSAELLGAGAVGVSQVLCVDAVAVGSVADTVALSSCQSNSSCPTEIQS